MASEEYKVAMLRVHEELTAAADALEQAARWAAEAASEAPELGPGRPTLTVAVPRTLHDLNHASIQFAKKAQNARYDAVRFDLNED